MINPLSKFSTEEIAMSVKLKFLINSTSESPARTKVNTRGFDLKVDTPESLEETDYAPNPVEYILAGYAGCIKVTAHLITKELDFDLENFKVDIQGFLNPAKSDEERAGYQLSEVKLQKISSIASEIEERWLKKLKNRNSIHDNLSNSIPIKFFLN